MISSKVPPNFSEICILAGGRSTRMGRDKSQLRLGTKCFLTHLKALGKELNLPVRVIRKDLIPACGPLSGIYTALKTSPAQAIVFLSCDMPLITPAYISKLLEEFTLQKQAIFTSYAELTGFPLILPCDSLPKVTRLIEQSIYSLQKLASILQASRFYPSPAELWQLANVNTPEDLKAARKIWRERYT